MYLAKGTILLISDDTPLYQWLVLGFAALLLAALVYLLIRKLKSLREEYYEDDEVDASLEVVPSLPSSNATLQVAAVPSSPQTAPAAPPISKPTPPVEEKRPTIIFNQPLPDMPASYNDKPVTPAEKRIFNDVPPVQPVQHNGTSHNVPPIHEVPLAKPLIKDIEPPQPKPVNGHSVYTPDVMEAPKQATQPAVEEPKPAQAIEPVKPVQTPIEVQPARTDINPPIAATDNAQPANSLQNNTPVNNSTAPKHTPNSVPVFNHNTPPAPMVVPLNNQAETTHPAINNSDSIDAILNSLTDIIFEFDENKVCLNVWYNKTRAMLVNLDTFKGKTISQNIGEEKAAEINKAIDHVISNHECTTIEFRSFFGSGRWFSAKISPVFDAHGEYTRRMTASVSDISEQKKYSAALKENQYQLMEAQKIAKMGNWWYDIERKQTYWSDNLFALLNTPALPAGVSHFEYYAGLVHPEDRRQIYQFFGNMTGNAHNEIEHRITTADGKPKYFLIIRGGILKNHTGTITRVTGIIKDVTESRLSERTIKKSQAELLEAQTIAKIGNWKWYFTHKTLQWSDEVYHIYEVDKPRQKHTGISNFKILLRYVHPDDRGVLLSFLKDPVNRNRSLYEYRIITPGNAVKYLSIIIGKIKRNEDGSVRNVVGTLQDITDRKIAELNIQKTEDSYQLVLEAIKLAAMSMDKHGVITFCNKFLANLLGYDQSEIIGLNWYETFVPENLKIVFRSWYENNDVKSTYINPIICRNGEQRIISWQNTTIYDEHGQIKQTTSIGEDITDQQKDRQELITAKEAAEKASLFKSDFLSTMSHEIRTPMNAVIGTTNLLMEENPRADQLPYLNNLKFSGETLLGIINDILDYNKIEAGKFELSKHPLNIHELMSNIRQSFHSRAMEKSLQLLMDVDIGIPKNLRGDAIRLGQILNNLMGNAIKFTQKGNVQVQVRETSRTEDKVKVLFVISDTGIGIEPDNLGKIFEPFVQESRLENYGGSGLGLAIVQRLIALHGSRIEVASTLGKGTQFIFSIDFDYMPAPAIPVPPAATLEQKILGATLSGMRVLVVDDNKMNILIANRFLNKWGVNTQEACNGAVAVEMVSQTAYDLIIMDLQMPVMDGFEATKIIKKTHPHIPVIALTADAMPETYTKASNLGMDDFLTKPFMPEILFEKVSKFYKKSSSVGADSLNGV